MSDMVCASAKGEGVWVVVQAKPGQEQRAKGELERQRFEAYLPMRLFEDKARLLRATPFLPPYLFARVPVEVEAWRCILSTYGVSGVLGATTRRAFGVSDRVVNRIREAEDAGYIRMGLQADRAFERGQRVRVDGGLEAIFSETVDRKRGVILFSLLGRDSSLTIDLSRLAAI